MAEEESLDEAVDGLEGAEELVKSERDPRLRRMRILFLKNNEAYPSIMDAKELAQKLPDFAGGEFLEINIERRTWQCVDEEGKVRKAAIGQHSPFYVDHYYGVIGVYDASILEQRHAMNDIASQERAIMIVPVRV